MCELLALSSSRLSHLTDSFHALSSHAQASARDGWGVAFYEDHDVALFREPLAASDSALVDFLQTHGPSTTLAISHIRHATVGAIELPNTQPFARELGGRMHVFAHNGTLPGIQQAEQFRLRRYQPVGTTDSEYAFCVLLDRLFGLWEANTPPTLEARLTLIAAFASQLRQLGPANFLYADSEILFAHGDRRIQVSDGSTRAPGLLLLERRCQDPKETLNASGMSTALSFQDSVLVASVALTNGPWRAFTEGELVAISLGKVLTSVVTAAVPTQVIELTLVGSGEPMIRMEKRLRCAAFALGVSLKLDHAIALDELGLRHDEIPALIHHGKVAMKGLARTEDIEVWLKNIKNESQPIYLDHR